jgi:hypothetical protein
MAGISWQTILWPERFGSAAATLDAPETNLEEGKTGTYCRTGIGESRAVGSRPCLLVFISGYAPRTSEPSASRLLPC